MIFGRKDYNKRIIDTKGEIPEDEPVFLLRSTDKLAPKLLLQWAMELRLNGGDPLVARNAEDHAQAMLDYQAVHGCKTPDMIRREDSELSNHYYNKIVKLLETPNLNISELTSLVGQYYNVNDQSLVYVLMPMEVKDGCPNPTKLEDFNLDENAEIQVCKAKLVIYYKSKSSPVTVIKNILR